MSNQRITEITKASEVSCGKLGEWETVAEASSYFESVMENGGYAGLDLTFLHEEDRDEFLAMFPKYVKWASGEISGRFIEGTCDSAPWPSSLPYTVRYTAKFNFTFHPQVSGDRNEAGEKKVRKVFSVLESLCD